MAIGGWQRPENSLDGGNRSDFVGGSGANVPGRVKHHRGVPKGDYMAKTAF